MCSSDLFAYYSAKSSAGSIAYVPEDFDRDLNWQVVHRERQLVDGLELLHLPGHTPGLLGARIDTEPPLLIAGDEAFFETNYRDEQQMGASLLWGSQAWAESLRRLRDIERRHGATVLFGHDHDQIEAIDEDWPSSH